MSPFQPCPVQSSLVESQSSPGLIMVQVLPMPPPKERTSPMSSLSRLMILLSPATTDRDNSRVYFKWLSLKTFVFGLCFFGLFLGVDLFGYQTGFYKHISSLNQVEGRNIIDYGSQLASFAMMPAQSALPFFFASGTPSISQLALTSDLRWPNYGLMYICGSLLAASYVILGKALYWVQNCKLSELMRTFSFFSKLS